MELLAPPYQGGVGGVDVSCYFMKLVLHIFVGWAGEPVPYRRALPPIPQSQ
jgi:hypothetical protein